MRTVHSARFLHVYRFRLEYFFLLLELTCLFNKTFDNYTKIGLFPRWKKESYYINEALYMLKNEFRPYTKIISRLFDYLSMHAKTTYLGLSYQSQIAKMNENEKSKLLAMGCWSKA